ncbi:MAG: S41 family peptidase [Phycisphaeraceae bacterium]|nr:S41 family peptidase [Phycisphaeraceae bacterium]
MIRTGKFSITLKTTAAALLLAACAQVPVVKAQPAADLALSEQIVDLAERGKFTELAHVVDTLPASPEAKSLDATIDLYLAHLKDRKATKLDAHNEALEEAFKLIGETKPEDAMIKVIEAHSLAENPDKLLTEQRVAELIQTVAGKAEKAYAKNDFVESLSLYRLLDLLYEKNREYKKQYEDAATHVRVLQLYNPQLLRDLYKQRAERLGNEDELELFEEAGNQDIEDWTIKLEGINTGMLGQVFAHAATRHIDKDGYVALVRGAATGMGIMIQTDGLETVFESMADQGKVDAMQAKLDEVLKDLGRPGRNLNRANAMSIIADIMQTNLETIALPESVIVHELTQGACTELDQFTAPIWPEDLKQFARTMNGNFVGIGVQIQKLDGKLTVVTPLEGTPAMKAGLKANDVIAKVGGVPTGTWTVDKAVREITGPEDTKVTLTMLREGKEPFDVTLIRKPINIESIKGFAHRDTGGWDYWVDKDAGIGYIRMTQFLRQTAADMDKAVQQMQREGELNAIVLDLRFNPGGLLSTAIGVVDRFIDRGRIVSTVNAEGITTTSQSASRRNTYNDDIELVILINQGSASASEIVSGALQDYERATVLGENSYGKGSVQDIFPLGRGESLFKCTTQYYQLPKGDIIHRKDDSTEWGIKPDLEVKMTNKEVADWLEARRDADILIAEEDRDPENPQTDPKDILADGLDPQLEAAVLLLKAKQLSSRVELARKGE